jgi:hypothetical protein
LEQLRRPKLARSSNLVWGPRVATPEARNFRDNLHFSYHRRILDYRDLPSNARLTLSLLANIMIASTAKLLLLGLILVGETVGQYDPNLVGTWSTKSAKVITGPVRTLPLCHDAH